MQIYNQNYKTTITNKSKEIVFKLMDFNHLS